MILGQLTFRVSDESWRTCEEGLLKLIGSVPCRLAFLISAVRFCHTILQVVVEDVSGSHAVSSCKFALCQSKVETSGKL